MTEAQYWRQRYEMLMATVSDIVSRSANPPMKMLADAESYNLGKLHGAAAEREAMVAEAAKQGWAMRNEDAFEDAVREIAAIRARGQA